MNTNIWDKRLIKLNYKQKTDFLIGIDNIIILMNV